MSRRRSIAVAGPLTAALVLASTAAAFDCIRVSSSLEGLEHSGILPAIDAALEACGIELSE